VRGFGSTSWVRIALLVSFASLATAGCGSTSPYALTRAGAKALGVHVLAFDAGGGVYLATASGFRKLTSATDVEDSLGERPFLAHAPAISPTGEWVAYLRGSEDEGGDFYLVDPSGLRRQR
jgi:hypothetical protein